MSLGKKLRTRLKDMKVGGAGAGATVEVDDGGYHAKVAATEIDKLAVLADCIEVWNDALKTKGRDVERIIEAQARRVEKRIGYLLERFRTVEFDRQDGILQMRSVEPRSAEGGVYYYELLLTGGWKASLRRCRGRDGEPGREVVPANLTLEVIERLIDDLADALEARP